MNSISSRVEQIQQRSKGLKFLFGRAAGVCEMHKCTHTSCLQSQTHIDSRDYNYKDSHNVASRYAASVIASPVATWQLRSLATATAQCAASGPASPTIPTSEYLWEGGTGSLQSEDTIWSILPLRQWQLSVLKASSWALIYPPVRKCPVRTTVWKTHFLKTFPVSTTGKKNKKCVVMTAKKNLFNLAI